MADRPLNISKAHIARAAQDKDYLEALAFALMIKASHRNSMILNASTKAIMKILHCSGEKAKKIEANALKYNLITYTGYEQKHIISKKFSRNKEKERTVRFYIHTNDDGSFHLYIKSNFKEKKGYLHQTFADIKNLILAIAVLIGIDKHNGYINTLKNSKGRKYSLRTKEERCCRIWNKDRNANKLRDHEISKINKGYSHGEILQHTFNNNIGVYKLRQLIQFLKDERLIKVSVNVIPLKKINDDDPTDIKDFSVFDKDKNSTYIFTDRNAYVAKKKSHFNTDNCLLSDELRIRKGNERMVCIRFANNYLNTSDYLKLTISDKKKKNRCKTDKQSIECKMIDDMALTSLPFWG